MYSIISLFTDLEEVEHLQFKSDYSDIINEVITAYYEKIMNQLIFEEDDVDDLKSKCLAIKKEKPSTLIYEMTDIIMNRFLEVIISGKSNGYHEKVGIHIRCC